MYAFDQVGDDLFGENYLKSFQQDGVDTTHIEISKESPTGTATIIVNGRGENIIVITMSANAEVNEEVAEKHEDALEDAAIVMIQAEVSPKGNKRIFELAKDHDVQTFFNPAPGDPNLDKSILSLTDIICTNESETEFITGIKPETVHDAKKAAAEMITMGPEHAIITLGAQGSSCFSLQITLNARQGFEICGSPSLIGT
ncbi:unnamed protein product [Cylicostephanus goldi]|uniref:Carbohydrate kinase PfkB domain-containing protein n=1 Tax=Cylicostephanus goldi TaxID=71465 RepID=A0A3P6UIX9_CYLGO|nr:unnamed protein product [Cylicostephanus goldi]